jgi:CPA2 family monovalent cation:H+ antiporter-2
MSEHRYLVDVLILLVAVVVVVPAFQKVRLGTVLAYLAAGVAIGPWGLQLIENPEALRGLAELGVVFLLFSVGLEISLERLRLFGRGVYGLAIGQVVLTTLVVALAAVRFGLSVPAAYVVGGAIALSSTAIALQLLSERGQMSGQLGRTAIAILLIQDLAVAPMLVFINGVGAGGEGVVATLAGSLLKFAVFITMVAAAERILLRPVLRLAADAGAPEVFTGATLLIVLGVGWISEMIGLSMALGAFLAGLLVADTEFRHQVAADIQPFRGLLLGLFFGIVGMGLDLGYAAKRAGDVALLVIAISIAKAVVLAGIALVLGHPRGRALALGGLLSQGSEFAFVLFAAAAARGLLAAEQAQLLTVAIGVSMAITPVGAMLIDRLFPAGSGPANSLLGNLEEQSSEIRGHVVVAGFGQVGMAVARFLAGEHVPVLILDMTPKKVTASRARGLRVFYANAARLDVLRAARLDRAHALVVAVPDATVAEQITAIAGRAFPDLSIFVRAPDDGWVDRLKTAGADAIVLEGLTTALELAERVMLVYAPELVADE